MVEQSSPVTTQIIATETGNETSDVPEVKKDLSTIANAEPTEQAEDIEPIPPTPISEATNDSVIHFRIVEQLPEFPGGMTA